MFQDNLFIHSNFFRVIWIMLYKCHLFLNFSTFSQQNTFEFYFSQSWSFTDYKTQQIAFKTGSIFILLFDFCSDILKQIHLEN